MDDVRHVLTILAVEDVARARRFYDALLGWEAAVAVPVYVELRHPGGMRLGLYERRGFARNTGRPAVECGEDRTHAAELYLACADPAAAITRALAAGGELLSPLAPRDWGDDVGYLRDPDGHVVAISR